MNWRKKKTRKLKKVTTAAADSPRETLLPDWQLLAVFCLYRLLLVSLLTGTVITGWGPDFLGRSYPELFWLTSLIYIAAAIAFGFAAAARIGEFYFQVVLQLALDIVVITLMMHASGGVPSGLGVLLVIVVAAGGILTVGRTASALAAMATLALLFEQSYSLLLEGLDAVSYMQAGFLGATLFATALLAQVLAARIRRSEALTAEQSRDLTNLEQLNEYIIQRLQSGLLVVDDDDILRLMNRAAQDLLGLKQAQTGSRLATIAPPLAVQLSHWRGAQRTYKPEAFYSSFDQPKVLPRFIALDKGSGILVFLEDVSVLASQAQQLKLASLGRLTASIAHEVRNPLGAISHAGQLLRESSGLDVGEQRLLEIILNHCARVNGIIENVLQLSRRKRSHREILNLKPWLEQFLEEFCQSREIDRSRVALGFDSSDTRVYVDPSQLHQIVWNLCDNGWRHAQGSDRFPPLQLWAGSKDNSGSVFVEVIDTGPGITEEAADKIFEPFFTTRRTGTGLGLYIARELAEGNEAHLQYRPAAGGGSCFQIRFRSLATEVNAA